MSVNFKLFFWLVLGIFGFLAFYLGRKKIEKVLPQKGLFFEANIYGWFTLLVYLIPVLLVNVIVVVLSWFKLIQVPWSLLFSFILIVGAVSLWLGLKFITPALKPRYFVEKCIVALLILASLISIFTTIGIVLSILFEAIHFFSKVSLWEFLTGTVWEPDTAFLGAAGRTGELVAKPKFGAVPLFTGTLVITSIALMVALPVGLFSAIYLVEYARPKVRKILKPALEILAGIPTVVYGFFAAITVSPLVVDIATKLGLEAEYTNALSPGLVMGIMIIPLISSLSDDVINAIPQNMREGSLALGATQSETILKIILPAALPGIVSAFLLAVSRTVGETMIVVMAAGLQANLTLNPLKGMTTVTVRIVDALTGDQAFDSLETLSAFGLGLALTVFTLILNVISLIVIKKFKQQYEV